MSGVTHSHDGVHSHSHDGFDTVEHGHSHEILDGPGSYLGREMPITEGRIWQERAFTIGIGGYAQTHLTNPPFSSPSSTLLTCLISSIQPRRVRQNRPHARTLPGPAQKPLPRRRD